MKKIICLLMCLTVAVFCFVGCDSKNPDKDTVTNEAVTDKSGEVIKPAQNITDDNSSVVQPSNALQRVMDGMLLCYLEYIVEDSDFYAVADAAVTPAIIENPADFEAFFEYADENGKKTEKAKALYDEMTLTDEGKAIYTDANFYDNWHLIIVSVRESNSETKHTIDSVEYSTDSCIFTVNATRDVADGEGEPTAYHYVFRVPKNVYNGVRHSFKKS